MAGLTSQTHIRAEQRRFQRAQDGRAWTVKDLPKFYYHKNFRDILTGIESELPHLLDPVSQRFITGFNRLTFAQQCAYTRMAGRKGTVFNIDRFDYPEIPSLGQQFVGLERSEFVRRPLPGDLKSYLSNLTKPLLLALMETHLPRAEFRPSWKKDKLVQVAVDKIPFNDISIPQNIWVQCHSKTLDFLLFLNSGHIENGLQNRTLRDLGIVKTPKSDHKYGQRFETAGSAASAWFYARELRNSDLENSIVVNAIMDQIKSWPDPICDKSRTDRDKLLYKVGAALEKQSELQSALKIYALADSDLCNERAIRLRYKLGDKSWVRTRLESLLENPNSLDEHIFAQDFYARKFKKKRTSILTDMLRDADSLTLDEGFKHQPEQAATRHYKDRGIDAIHTENMPWRTLFGLLFWDEIFPNGATAGQTILNSPQFYNANKKTIDGKLKRLRRPKDVKLELLKILSSNYGTRQNIFRWKSRSLDHIGILLDHSPKDALGKMMRVMAQNWPNTKDGFPDLLLVEDGICRFIEVKAPGDVIRRNQLTRLKQLKSAGYRADILQINWAVDPNQTYVVVDVETTGGRPGLHRVTEIGAVKIKGGKVIDEWSSLINPQRTIPAKITQLTGISHSMVAQAPVFHEIADTFETFIGDAIFAAHNVNFDYGFIKAEFQMIDRRFRHPKICTCSSMRKLFPGHRSYSLKNLCRDYNIDLESHHRALCDAKAAAQLLCLINEKRLRVQSQNEAFTKGHHV